MPIPRQMAHYLHAEKHFRRVLYLITIYAEERSSLSRSVMFMKPIRVLTLQVIILLMAGCTNVADMPTFTPQSGNDSSPPPDMSQDEIALGKMIYANNCSSCHGENLEGETGWKQQNEDGSFRSPPHSADGHTWHHADSVLIESIEKGGTRFEDLNIGGTSNMPAFAGTLTDEEIAAVLTYIKSTWPEDIRAIQWQQTVQSISQ